MIVSVNVHGILELLYVHWQCWSGEQRCRRKPAGCCLAQSSRATSALRLQFQTRPNLYAPGDRITRIKRIDTTASLYFLADLPHRTTHAFRGRLNRAHHLTASAAGNSHHERKARRSLHGACALHGHCFHSRKAPLRNLRQACYQRREATML